MHFHVLRTAKHRCGVFGCCCCCARPAVAGVPRPSVALRFTCFGATGTALMLTCVAPARLPPSSSAALGTVAFDGRCCRWLRCFRSGRSSFRAKDRVQTLAEVARLQGRDLDSAQRHVSVEVPESTLCVEDGVLAYSSPDVSGACACFAKRRTAAVSAGCGAVVGVIDSFSPEAHIAIAPPPTRLGFSGCLHHRRADVRIHGRRLG